KLAAEATRIKLAYLFDPMMAVHTSDVMPLPHQISAVYEAMLPRQPLRFVLADDPGSGKTIMAGLLIRELLLRGDLERCLIVAPGSLVEQWQTELVEKFGLRFDLLTTALVESTARGNPFVEHNLLIARLDQLSRKEEWQDKLRSESARWDLVIVDEAHKMAAHYGFGNELKTTRRFELGKLLGHPERARNFLLMTATPHNGKEEDFQAWLALIDEDRFHGKAREKATPMEIADIMRRMVKEDLITFDGAKLFPERRAYTVKYKLTPAEKSLYDEVTDYVRHEMGRADALEGKKKGMVGFALTILQRRLASSPNAIAQSLRRRRERLQERLEHFKGPAAKPAAAWEDLDADELDEELTAEELEEVEEELVDEATAAKTIPELQAEIDLLKGLEKKAQDVLKSGVDRKWEELSKILQSDSPEMFLPGGRRRKMLIFTEHKDTLDYLRKRIANVLEHRT
ncbi:MAG: DEAD/DEAH box helicase, partial [Candidatus Limnocylindria bacterium]